MKNLFQSLRKLKFLSIVFYLFMAPLCLQASESPPGISEPGIDLKLTGGKSVESFFLERKRNAPCQSQLKEVSSSYASAKSILDEMISTSSDPNQIEQQEKKVVSLRDQYLSLVNECGHCTLRPIEKYQISQVGRREFWYVTDGSCFLGDLNPQILDRAYQEKVESLKKVSSYSHKSGGLPGILEFFPVDHETGKQLPDKELLDSPFFSFIAYKGLSVLGVHTCFSFYQKVTFEEHTKNGSKEFVQRFESVKSPRGLLIPPIFDLSASQRKIPYLPRTLSSANGFWFLNPNGYLRFTMAGDLRMSFDFAIEIAKMTLLDNLVEFYKRGLPETP